MTKKTPKRRSAPAYAALKRRGGAHVDTEPRSAKERAAVAQEEDDAGLLRTTEAGNDLVDGLLRKHTKGLAARKPIKKD